MDPGLGKAIGARIRSVRKRSGLTQEELAFRIGRAVMTVSNVERGTQTPDVDTLVSLCRTLNVSLDFVTGASEERDVAPSVAGLEASIRSKMLALTEAELRQLDEFADFIVRHRAAGVSRQ